MARRARDRTAPERRAPDWENRDAEPLRRCIATGTVQPAAGMIRLVLGPDGTVVPDLAGRLPGRGFWLSARRDAVKTACGKNLFAKAAKARAVAPPELDQEIERQLVRRCQDILGFARRAGQTAAGFEKAAAMVRSGNAGLVMEAADGASNGRAKMAAIARSIPLIGVLTGIELGAAAGRDFAVHVAVQSGPIAEKLRLETARLQGFRPEGSPQAKPLQVFNKPDESANGLK